MQETSDVPCDTGSDPDVLYKELVEEKGLPVDLELLDESWNVKVGLVFFGAWELFFWLTRCVLGRSLFPHQPGHQGPGSCCETVVEG